MNFLTKNFSKTPTRLNQRHSILLNSCTSHTDCDSGTEYCASGGECDELMNCFIYENSIDNQCPEEPGTAAVDCTKHSECEVNYYCTMYNTCYEIINISNGKNNCENDEDSIDGVCPKFIDEEEIEQPKQPEQPAAPSAEQQIALAMCGKLGIEQSDCMRAMGLVQTECANACFVTDANPEGWLSEACETTEPLYGDFDLPLTCQMLTLGQNVPEWEAALKMAEEDLANAEEDIEHYLDRLEVAKVVQSDLEYLMQ